MEGFYQCVKLIIVYSKAFGNVDTFVDVAGQMILIYTSL